MTGDADDMRFRIRRLLPVKWFGDEGTTPILDALLTGIGTAFAAIYALITFTRLTARLTTSAGMFIDLWAQSWFGTTAFPRQAGETDAVYIARIKANLFLVKATRPSLVATMTAATGVAPVVLEPQRVIDTGGLATLATPAMGGGGGYDVGGIYYGSLLFPGAFFVTTATGPLTDTQSYANIAAALPAGVVAWSDLTD